MMTWHPAKGAGRHVTLAGGCRPLRGNYIQVERCSLRQRVRVEVEPPKIEIPFRRLNRAVPREHHDGFDRSLAPGESDQRTTSARAGRAFRAGGLEGVVDAVDPSQAAELREGEDVGLGIRSEMMLEELFEDGDEGRLNRCRHCVGIDFSHYL